MTARDLMEDGNMDPLMMNPATSELQHGDSAVRVALWRLPELSEVGWHTHEHDCIVVPVRGGTMTIGTREKGRVDCLIAGGRSYVRSKGTMHDVINQMDNEIAFAGIELKASAGD